MNTNPNHASTDDVSLLPTQAEETGSALDALLIDLDPSSEAAIAAKAKAEADAAAKAAEAAGAAAPKKEDKEDTLQTTVDADAKETADAEAKAKADADAKAAAEAEAAAKAAGTPAPEKDEFEGIELPPHTKPASGEAFKTLKAKAREVAATLKKEVEDLKAKLTTTSTELETVKSTAGSATPETLAELEDLRKFRLSKDVESDPEFQKFNTSITKNDAKILEKMKLAGVSEKSLAQIKEIGTKNVEWEAVLDKLPIGTRRFIEATLVENVRLEDQRADALTAAQANASAYLTEKQTREATTLISTANEFLKSLPWTAEKQVPANATDAVKAEIKAHNDFAKASSDKLKGYLADRSPSRFAELAIGTLIAYRQKDQITQLSTQVETLTKTNKEALDKITAERDKLAADLLAIKKAQRPRGGGEIIPAARPKSGINDTSHTIDALDALAAEVMAAD